MIGRADIEQERYTILLVEDDLNDIFLVKRGALLKSSSGLFSWFFLTVYI